MTLHLSLDARHDLDEIVFFSLIRFGPGQALRYATALRRAVETLADMPRRAPIRPEIGDGTIRVLPYKAHVIIYREAEGHVTVIRVLDARRDWAEVIR